MSELSSPDVVIIGAGVSGLTVAFELLERADASGEDLNLVCLEAAARPGGNIRTETDSEFVCEWGPNGFLDNAPATLDLVRRLELDDRMIRASEQSAVRFIYRAGRLRRVPTGALAFLTSGILPPLAKLRLLGEPLIRGRGGDGDESILDFASRRIGSTAASLLVDAMVSGVYAGDVARLSLPATFPKMRRMESDHGGLFRAMLARRKGGGGGGPAGPGGRLTSFRAGLQVLTDTLADRLGDRLQTNCPVVSVTDRGRRGFRVLPRDGAPIDTPVVVLAGPAPVSAELVREMDPAMAGTMNEIPSASLAVVHFGFPEDAIGYSEPGFGFLVPRGQGLRILGTLWSSHIFEGRAPKNRRLLTTMIGGAHDSQAAELEDGDLIRIVRHDLMQSMQVNVAPYFTRIFRHPRGIPQYTMGHLDRVAQIEERLGHHPGLFVSGNSYHGISVNLCVEEAPRVAEAVLAAVRHTAEA